MVQLIDHMGDDLRIVNAARVSYGSDDLDKLEPTERDKRLIKYLLTNRHTSPFEHVQFTFRVEAPIFVARQWMRHRTGKYNEISGRYTELPENYYIPQEWRGQSKTNHQGSEGRITGQMQANKVYIHACKEAFRAYRTLLELGVAREQARMVLPLSTFTAFYFTIDLHNLLHFLDLRLHPHAQGEIRVYADLMLEAITPVVPNTIQVWMELRNDGTRVA